MSELTYFQRQQGNTIPQQLNVIQIIPIQDNPYPPSPNTSSGTLPNFITAPAPYPATSYNQSNIPIQNNPYPPSPNTSSLTLPNFITAPAPYPATSDNQSQNMIPQQITIVPKVLNGEGNSSQQYQPNNPIPLNQENIFQPYSKTNYNLGTSNLIMIPMEQNNLLQGNLSNQIHFSNPPTNQQNIVQYNIFPQAINSFNSSNQSFAPYEMNLANNVNNYNGNIIHRENIMNQYGQNKNNINTNSGLQNLSINNDRNTNEKNIVVNKDLVAIPIKKVQFECPRCHEEYSRDRFFSGRKKKDFIDSGLTCRSCNKLIKISDFFFECEICKLSFCDDCTLKN